MKNLVFICSILIILFKTGNVLSDNNIFNVNNIEIKNEASKNNDSNFEIIIIFIEDLIASYLNQKLVSLHSHLTDIERLDNWRKAKSGEARIVIGTRLAIFTPMSFIKIIIIYFTIRKAIINKFI